MDINEKRRLRFLFIKNLYESSDGDSRHVFNVEDNARKIGISRDHAIQIADYLNKEGLSKMSMDKSSVMRRVSESTLRISRKANLRLA